MSVPKFPVSKSVKEPRKRTSSAKFIALTKRTLKTDTVSDFMTFWFDPTGNR